MQTEITLRLTPKEAYTEALLRDRIAEKAGTGKINDYRITRRSIDARKKQVMVNLTVIVATGADSEVKSEEEEIELRNAAQDAPVLIIVGAGPAGLFAALEALRHGIRPVLLERGRDVDSRRKDIADISRKGMINPESNYCFGEGGAGAYSDGKLYTRSKKRGSVDEVLRLLVQHGASPEILIDAHPHIGSDRLPHVIRNIRKKILAKGGEVRFETRVTGLIAGNGQVAGVRTEHGPVYGDAVILATGHSAHDTFRQLHADGMSMEPKGIAVGVRLEHPQELIDRIQYHSPGGRGKYLPAAEYQFVAQAEGRGVYSFCMCPGGVIVPAGSSAGELVVNGMSASARAGKWANSGMVVEIHPGDIEGFGQEGALEMLALQEDLERKMYQAAGESIKAPAQRMTDFVSGRLSDSLPQTSYAPGLVKGDFNKLLPEFISRRLSSGLQEFGKKAKGFMTSEGIMIGLESRTSSPIRMTRDSATLLSVGMQNLYPAGEGAGYAGGIVSAAIDGMRCARAFARSLNNEV